jgi:hypothetical protein
MLRLLYHLILKYQIHARVNENKTSGFQPFSEWLMGFLSTNFLLIVQV